MSDLIRTTVELEEACWAIDCMTGLDTSALRALIEDEDVVKILHNARQDLTHLHL